MLLQMFTVHDEAVGPHVQGRGASADHERLVLEARDVAFDWAKLPFHYVPGEPFTTHVLNVLHLLLPAGEEFFVDVFKQALPLIKDDQLRLDVQGFIGQEAMHSQAHTGVLDYFAANDIDVTPFTDQIELAVRQAAGRPAAVECATAAQLAARAGSGSSRQSSTTPRFWASGFSTPRSTTRSAPTR